MNHLRITNSHSLNQFTRHLGEALGRTIEIRLDGVLLEVSYSVVIAYAVAGFVVAHPRNINLSVTFGRLGTTLAIIVEAVLLCFYVFTIGMLELIRFAVCDWALGEAVVPPLHPF